MSLKMKSKCEKCGRELKHDSDSYICSYECTFCAQCAEAMNRVCPNCMGELVKRPKREIKK